MTLKLHDAADVPVHAAAAPRIGLPRVLYVIVLDPGSKFGSMEEQVVLLAERFREEGGLFLPLFAADPEADVSQFQKRGIDARCLELRRFSWRTLWQLRRIIREQNIDIVNWNFMPGLTNLYVWALSVVTPGVRHWYTDHNSRLPVMPAPDRGVKKFLKRLMLKRYGRVLCVSHFVQQCLEAQGPWSNLACTPHFINTERFRPDPEARSQMRRARNVEQNFVLLTVGQLIKEKGIDVAIRAMAELPARVVLWVVGSGPEEEALEKLVDELHLQERVQILGLQRHVQPFMQAADCFVCPSLWCEAAGLVNLEALACGKPVIASRIGGIPEYVAHGRTGLLFTPGSEQELAQCVRQIEGDTELCNRLAQQARIDAIARFSPAAGLPTWLDLYRSSGRTT